MQWKFWHREPCAFDSGWVEVGSGHKIYYLQYGNPQGIPVLSFHGGPGGASRPKYIRLFDLRKYRFIQFDQRACGQSQYEDAFRDNDTAHLLADAGKLLQYLNISAKIIVHGASWGSTLALLFAENYPDKVSAIVVSSVFLAREYDYKWADSDSKRFYPDMFAIMLEQINSDDIRGRYSEMLFSDDTENQRKALQYFGSYEYMLGSLNPRFTEPEAVEFDRELLCARIAFHYAGHRYFIRENQILDEIEKIRNIPALIVHNRMDFCCPPQQAWELHKAMPQSELIIIPDYGHSTSRILRTMRKKLPEFL